MNPHIPKWTPTLGVGVPMDFQIFRGQLQGSKFIGLKSFIYHWKSPKYGPPKLREFECWEFWEFQDFQLGSPGTKWRLGVGPMARHKEYCKGEGSGFPQVRAMVNFMSPCLPKACLLMHPKFFTRLKCESKLKTSEKQKVEAHSLAHSTLRGRRAC